jgi:hypothetical protein
LLRYSNGGVLNALSAFAILNATLLVNVGAFASVRMYALWYPSTNFGQGAVVANSGATIGGQFAVRVVVQPNSGSIITASVIHQSITEQTDAHPVSAGQLAEFEVASPNPQYGDPTQNVVVLQSPFVNLAGHNGTYQIQVTVRYVTGPIPFHYGVYEETATMTLTMSNLVLVDSREEPYFVWKPLEVAPPPESLNMLNVPEDPIAVGPTVPFSVQIQHAQSGVCTLRLEIFTSDNNEVPILVKQFTNVPRPGTWQWEWDGRLADGSTAPRGIYLYRLSAEARVPTLPDRDSNRSETLRIVSSSLDFDYDEEEWIATCNLSGAFSSGFVQLIAPISLGLIQTASGQPVSGGYRARLPLFEVNEGDPYIFLMRAWDWGNTDGSDKAHRRREALPLNQRNAMFRVALVGMPFSAGTLNYVWNQFKKCPPFRTSVGSALYVFTPPAGERNAVFVSVSAQQALFYLNATACGTEMWIGYAHGAGDYPGYGMEFSGSWLWSSPSVPALRGVTRAYLEQLARPSRRVIMTGCASGANWEDPRSLMGQLRTKGVPKRVSMKREVNMAECQKFLEAFADSTVAQVRGGTIPNFYKAVEQGAKAIAELYQPWLGSSVGAPFAIDPEPVLYNETVVRVK